MEAKSGVRASSTEKRQDSGSARFLLPPLAIPLIYFSFAVVCFAAALGTTILYAQDFTGFYYHPHILAITHLITLGWITSNILGSLYILGTMTLGMPLRAGAVDYFILTAYLGGVVGMIGHFWIGEASGLLWSASFVYAALLVYSVKMLRSLRGAKTPGFVRLHVAFAFANILVAGAWAVLIATNKVWGFLPVSSGPSVVAHAHLAALGWACMMVFGAAYRLLPMFIPAKPASGKWPWISAILLQSGTLGLFFATLVYPAAAWLFGVLFAAGVVVFLALAFETARSRKPAPPPEPPRPDFSLLHAPASFFWLFIAIITGFFLLALPPAENSLRLALAYGVMGIVGFLSQMVVGMKPKMLAIFSWYFAFTARGDVETIPRPVDMPIRTFQLVTFALWTIAIPLLVTGTYLASRFTIIAGAVTLLAALLLSTIHEASIVALIFKGRKQ